MKKFLKTTGYIFLMVLIYFLVQILTGICFMIPFMGKIIAEVSRTGIAPEEAKLKEDMLNYFSSIMSPLMIISIIITLAIFFIIFKARKIKIKSVFLLEKISLVNLLVIAGFGISFNIILAYVLDIISKVNGLRPAFEDYSKLFEQIVGGNSIVLTLFTVGVLAPIFEEILFRGIIFNELRKNMKVYLAIIIQAIIFGVYHMNIVQGAYAIVFGLIIGALYYRTKSIIAAITLHISVNVAGVMMSQSYISGFMDSNEVLVLIISGLVLIGTSIILIRNKEVVIEEIETDNSQEYKTEETNILEDTLSDDESI